MNKNPEVDAFLVKKNHPMTLEINQVREIILSTDDRITEAIMWCCPTFIYKGNMASYFLNARKFVSLMFHKGAFIKDQSGLLEGDGKEGRVARFESLADINKKKKALEGVVKEWIRMQDAK
jgi:uncharacterized protein YdeI (YjbR/CyaY-like superfamily)